MTRHQPRRRGTYIGRALRNARRRLFRRRSPRGRKRALLVITDGVSADRVRRPALRLRKDGVEIFALGVGSGFRRRQLQLIASNRLNLFTAGFSRLGKVVKAIKEKVCEPAKPSPKRKFSCLLQKVESSSINNSYYQQYYCCCLDLYQDVEKSQILFTN